MIKLFLQWHGLCVSTSKDVATSSRRRRVNRDQEESRVHSPRFFYASFYIRHELFDKITEGVITSYDYFTQKPNAIGKLGFSQYAEITAVSNFRVCLHTKPSLLPLTSI
ncbi:hypothetical protein TB1_046037 [Malus domestica]